MDDEQKRRDLFRGMPELDDIIKNIEAMKAEDPEGFAAFMEKHVEEQGGREAIVKRNVAEHANLVRARRDLFSELLHKDWHELTSEQCDAALLVARTFIIAANWKVL